MAGRLRWDDDGAAHILSRSLRYPGALNVRPEWAEEVLADPEMLAAEPDPKSRIKAARLIGYSRAWRQC